MPSTSLFSFGNTKLPNTTAIFNMGPASNGAKGSQFSMTCPEFHRGTCQLPDPAKQCYAIKAERQYAGTRTMRKRQAEFWHHCAATTFVAEFTKARKRSTKLLRFNESGGIANVTDILKVADIARALPDLTVYLYTSRHDLWAQGAFDCLPPNVTVTGSGFMAHNKFTARPKDVIPDGAFICPMDCRVCSACSRRDNQTIFVTLH